MATTPQDKLVRGADLTVVGEQVKTKLATKQDVIQDLSTIRSGAASGATAVQPAALNAKQDVIEDLSAIRSGAAAGATSVQPVDIEDVAHFVDSGAISPLVDPSDYATTTQLNQLGQEVYGIRYIDNVSYSGAYNAEFQFSEVSNDTVATLQISGSLQNINYCVWYHGTTNVGLLALSDYTNAEVTIPATANNLKVFLKSGTTLDIIVNLKTSGVNERVTTVENDIDGLSESITSLNDSVAELDEATEFRAGMIDKSVLTNSTTSTDFVWFQKTPRLGYIDKIRFLAKTGTIYFYTVDTNTTPATITQIKSVVVSPEEDNTVKEFDININLEDGVYVGFNGAIRYSASSIAGYKGSHCNPDGTGMSAETDFVCGFEVASKINSAVTKNGESIVSLDARVTELEDRGVVTKTIGADLSQVFPQSTNNTTYLWAVKTPAAIGQAKVINFKAKAGTVNFFKVHAETIAIGESATITQIASVNNTSAEEGAVKSVVIDVEFGENDYLGINGAFYYNSSSSEPDFTTFFATALTGRIESTPSAFTAGCNIVIEVTESVRTIPGNIVFVDAKGNGDFLNPFDAMVALSGKDTAATPYTIVVAPGVYNMPTLPRDKFSTYCGNRFLAIVGTDKQNCILRNDKGYYNASASDQNNLGDNSPLKISGNIYIANLTIISTDTENASEAAEVYHLSYCIHIDAGAAEGSIMEVHNCRLINNHAPCIGFGIPKNVTLKITDCDLESDFWNPNISYGGAIVYGHDRDGSTSEVQEHLVIRNCVLKSSNGNAVKFVNNNNALADCVFVGNACDLPSGKGIVLGAGTSVVAPSFGNNLSEMNA